MFVLISYISVSSVMLPKESADIRYGPYQLSPSHAAVISKIDNGIIIGLFLDKICVP